jgi:hypothetical protein
MFQGISQGSINRLVEALEEYNRIQNKLANIKLCEHVMGSAPTCQAMEFHKPPLAKSEDLG